MRVDAELNEEMTDDFDEASLKDEQDTLTEVFKKALGKETLQVQVTNLKNENVSSMITLSEESRRMADMMKQYGMAGMDPNMFGAAGETLVLNAKNPLVKYIFENKDSEHVTTFCQQLYDLAAIAQRPLSAEDMTKFVTRSNEIMMLLAK